MKFYVVQDSEGSPLGCETSLGRARNLGNVEDGYQITRVECRVSAETIRLMLGGRGGYADESDVVEEVERSR